VLGNDPKMREPNAIQPACIEAMRAVAAQKFELFGAAGKGSLTVETSARNRPKRSTAGPAGSPSSAPVPVCSTVPRIGRLTDQPVELYSATCP
jgi:hypothetical protein